MGVQTKNSLISVKVLYINPYSCKLSSLSLYCNVNFSDTAGICMRKMFVVGAFLQLYVSQTCLLDKSIAADSNVTEKLISFS